jgi:hypothetical protein
MADDFHPVVLVGVGLLGDGEPRKAGFCVEHRGHRVPQAHEFDADALAIEHLLEMADLGGEILRSRLAEPRIGAPGIAHQLQLFFPHQPENADEAGQQPGGVGSAGKAENIDPVAIFVVPDQEFVGLHDIVGNARAGGEPEHDAGLGFQLLPPAIEPEGADAGLVEHQLVPRPLEAAIESQHIGAVAGNLVRRAVQQNDDVLGHGAALHHKEDTREAAFQQSEGEVERVSHVARTREKCFHVHVRLELCGGCRVQVSSTL